MSTNSSLRFPHPGELLQEYLEELKISAYRLAKETGVDPMRISEILRGKRGITGDTALRLARFFDTSPEYWMNLQSRYELRMAEQKIGPELERLRHHRDLRLDEREGSAPAEPTTAPGRLR
jgi:addiction module HigA family antidote